MKTTKNQWQVLVLVSIFLLLLSVKTTIAQEDIQFNNPTKYEVSVDLQHFFSDGYPDKVLFKINHIKDNQIKGAYRLGLESRYTVLKTEGKTHGDSYQLWQKEKKFNFSVLTGYEWCKYYKSAFLYYGIDLNIEVGNTNELPDAPGDSDYLAFGLTPFIGLKHFISSRFSASIEIGYTNELSQDKYTSSNFPNNKIKNRVFTSKLELPYSLTLNYNF